MIKRRPMSAPGQFTACSGRNTFYGSSTSKSYCFGSSDCKIANLRV